ncbi:MAG: site-specific DNA-methyltransferase [Bacteroidetes bacterium]|nr:site-specific DNA-methyltransferase [Bacteroidota bacterium]
MNKTELIHKLKQLEGLTTEERSALIELVNTKKKYGLVWEDKPEDVEELLRQNLPVLRELKEKYIEAQPMPPSEDLFNNEQTPTPLEGAGGRPAPNHLLIEGDNLHALTALSFTHKGKIDVIYIDPPYNTGKENEFRYNDRWILKEDPFKHSYWLNFISKRLNIAKQLLNENGVFICHIDENEFDALNLLLETEIFTSSDFLGVIIWNKLNPKGEVVGVATMHEYVLIYAKNKEKFKTLSNILTREKPNALAILNKAKVLFSKIGKKQIPESIKEVIKPFNYSKEILKDFVVEYDLELINTEFQVWLSNQDFSGGEKAYKFIDENGDVYRGVSMAAPDKPETRSHRPLLHPINRKPCPVPSKGWRNPDKTMDKLLEKGMILFGQDETKQPERKYLLKENLFEATPSIYSNGASDEELMKDLKLNFPYPKVTSASQYLLKNIHPNPKVILDFFAGSGTTLHATMALNAEDGGNRQCILVTNNENNICEEVTYERNKRVIQGYTNAKGVAVAGLTNNNLRYYKSEFVPSTKNEANRRLLTNASTELLCIRENCFTDITKQAGFKSSECKVFQNDLGKYMVVIYHSRNFPSVCGQVNQWVSENFNLPLEEKVRLYCFSPEKDSLAEDFADIEDYIEAVPLPDAIYNAFRATFKTLKLDRKHIELNPNEAEVPTTLFDDQTDEA